MSANPLDALGERLSHLREALAQSQEAARAAVFVTAEIMPLWRSAWEEALAACPPGDLDVLQYLRAEFCVMRAIERALVQMAQSGPEIAEQMEEVGAQAQEALGGDGFAE